MIFEDRVYTAEEFEAFADSGENSEWLLELVNGKVEEKFMTEEEGVITATLGAQFYNFVMPRKLGRVGVEIRYRHPEDKYNARIPDVSFSSAKTEVTRRGSTPVFPDLAIEIKSPDDSLMKLRDKAHFFLLNGTKMFWIVIPSKQLVEVYTAEEESIYTAEDTLSGGDVLPEFTLAVKDIFNDPIDMNTAE